MARTKLFSKLYHDFSSHRLYSWLGNLAPALQTWEKSPAYQRFQDKYHLLTHLPQWMSQSIELNKQVAICSAAPLTSQEQERLFQLLQQLKPWRKGPFEIHGLYLDSEWRSDWKWERVLPHLQPLTNRYVLDIGCGNGYYLWRMKGAGARCVVGADPFPLFFNQFLALAHFIQEPTVHYLPLGIDELPPLPQFDTVFSMGVLYHRRSPLDFLQQLKGFLRPGGELVLETLVTEGPEHHVLLPQERYAQMHNVWFLPSPATLISWLARLGFQAIRLVDLTQTTVQEQRATEWMDFQSLADFLDPQDPKLTIEGYPAPLRGIFIAKA